VSEILATPYFRITKEPGTILRLTRSSSPVPSPSEVGPELDAIVRVLDGAGRAEHGLLVDLRAAPLNNDPAFEAELARRRARLFGGFRRVAVLVRTAVGALQIARQSREQGSSTPTFQDEASAIAHLSLPPGR
jgi:hypothetical protein